MMHTGRIRRTTRRGAALLLVLIALAVGLLLVATWLDGRRESVPVARRVSAGAVARHAAASGLELVCASIDADPDWRVTLQTGGFAGTFRIDDVDASFTFEDADTGDPPTDETVRLRIRCEAASEEIPGIIERVLAVAPDETMVDVDFGETALIARDRVLVRDKATVLPWTGRPGNDGGVLVIGTFDGDPESVSIGTTALVSRSEIITVDDGHDPDARHRRGRRLLPDPLPPLPTPPSTLERDPDQPPAQNTVRLREPPEGRVVAGRVRIPGSARWKIDGDLEIRGDRRIELERGACIVIERGTLSLEAGRDLRIRGATILVRPGGRLELRAGQRVRLQDATLGQTSQPTLSMTDDGMLPTDADAEAIVIVAEERGAVEIGGRTLLAATVLSPEASVTLEDDAILHGRILAGDAVLRDDAVLFARPDDGRVIGLTSAVGPHRGPDGRLTPQLNALERTDESFLVYLAELFEVPVRADGRVVRPLLAATARAIRQARTEVLRSRRAASTAARWTWIDPHGDRR